MYQVLAIPAFSDNYIWLCHAPGPESAGRDPVATKAALVDPGEASPVMEAFDSLPFRPSAIFITHGHGDHVNGVEALVARYDIPVYGPTDESITCITLRLRDGDQVCIDSSLPPFAVMELPGHTRSDIAYYGSGLLFCGDTLFTGGCGRVFAGTTRQLYHSLQRIAALPDDTLIYCAHEYTLNNLKFALQVEPGNKALQERLRETERQRAASIPTVPSTLSMEIDTNPFLRSEVPEVIEAVTRFAGKKLGAGYEVFTALRYWRDTWNV